MKKKIAVVIAAVMLFLMLITPASAYDSRDPVVKNSDGSVNIGLESRIVMPKEMEPAPGTWYTGQETDPSTISVAGEPNTMLVVATKELGFIPEDESETEFLHGVIAFGDWIYRFYDNDHIKQEEHYPQLGYTEVGPGPIPGSSQIRRGVEDYQNYWGGGNSHPLEVGVQTYTVKAVDFCDDSIAYTRCAKRFCTEEEKELIESITKDYVVSPAEYRVTITVASNPQFDDDGNPVIGNNGKQVDKPYLESIVSEVLVPDNDTQKVGDKVDTLVFTNYYKVDPEKAQVDINDKTTWDNGLAITNTVTGKYANVAKDFDYTLKVDRPAYSYGYTDTSAKAKLLDANGKTLKSITVDYGEETTFKLAHGQSLVFDDIYIGATWNVTENSVTDGTTEDGYTVTQTISSGGASKEPTDQPFTVEKSGKNRHDFTNEKADLPTPTGLSMMNLPYYIILFLAFGGIAIFLIRARRRREQRS